MTEGPYFVDVMLNRSDIRSDPDTSEVKEGAPLLLAFRFCRDRKQCLHAAGGGAGRCLALRCRRRLFRRHGPQFQHGGGQKWLRGYQVTDAKGTAAFTTIYPGWYPGRTTIFKVRTDPDAPKVANSHRSFLMMHSATKSQRSRRAAIRGYRTTLNNQDGIFRDLLLLDVNPDGDGYAATFDLGLDLS